MLQLLIMVVRGLALALRGHRELVLENVALRQQLAAMQRAQKRVPLNTRDRLFWIALPKVYDGSAAAAHLRQRQSTKPRSIYCLVAFDRNYAFPFEPLRQLVIHGPRMRWLGLILSGFKQNRRGIERRAVDRLHLPLCPSCHSQKRMYVQSRYSYAVYFNCRDCNETIVLTKPRG